MSIVEPPRTLKDAIEELLLVSRMFRSYPFQVRQRFEKVLMWLPSRDAAASIELVNTPFAKRIRDKAHREIGWRLANHLVVLLKDVVDREIGLGFLSKHRVRNVTLLRPPRAPGSCRRRLPDARHPTPSVPHIDRYLVIVRDDKTGDL